jgi:hypothetical protein
MTQYLGQHWRQSNENKKNHTVINKHNAFILPAGKKFRKQNRRARISCD